MLSANVKNQQVSVGDLVRVHSTIVEGSKSRVQMFEGQIIRIRGRGENKTLTVRRVGAGGVGVEKSWPLDSRSLVKVDIKKKINKVRRSKLYYLRGLVGKAAVRV